MNVPSIYLELQVSCHWLTPRLLLTTPKLQHARPRRRESPLSTSTADRAVPSSRMHAQERTPAMMRAVSARAMAICAVCYIGIGFFGYRLPPLRAVITLDCF